MTTVKNNDHQIIKYLWQYRVYSAAKKNEETKNINGMFYWLEKFKMVAFEK